MDEITKSQDLQPYKLTDSNFVSKNKEVTSVLLATSNQSFVKEFGSYAKTANLQVQYVWSLEGIDFIPLWRVGVAVISSSAWRGHEVFGRPVDRALEAFKKIYVVLEPSEPVPSGNLKSTNVEYVIGMKELKKSISKFASLDSAGILELETKKQLN